MNIKFKKHVVITAGLTLLFLWKAQQGIFYYDEWEQTFRKQRIFSGWEPFLAQANLVCLLITGVWLLLGVLRKRVNVYGIGLATALLALYTVYSQLVWTGAFGLNSCTCIGWFKNMSWPAIFTMNLLLLFVAILCLLVRLKERRSS